MDYLLSSLFLIVCVLLIIIVLLQRGRGGGLSAAFGGMGSHSAFGTRTGDVFTWVTIILVSVFLLLAIFSTRHFKPQGSEQVDQPIMVPAGKVLERATTITINSPTPRAEIYYTQDGTNPSRINASSTKLYDSPVRIEPGTTLKAFAVLRGWKDSKVTEANYPVAGTSRPAEPTTSAAAK